MNTTRTTTLPTVNNIEYGIANNAEHTTVNYNSSIMEPYDYNIKIRFFFEDNILWGQCNISIRINHQLQFIKINSVPINTIKAFLIESINRSVYKFSLFTNNNNILAINFADKVPPAQYTFIMTYVRIININIYIYIYINIYMKIKQIYINLHVKTN